MSLRDVLDMHDVQGAAFHNAACLQELAFHHADLGSRMLLHAAAMSVCKPWLGLDPVCMLYCMLLYGTQPAY